MDKLMLDQEIKDLREILKNDPLNFNARVDLERLLEKNSLIQDLISGNNVVSVDFKNKKRA